MKVVECVQTGSIRDLQFRDRPIPEPGPNMVLLTVDAAGVNYVDALFVQGKYQIKPPVPFVPGSEISGTVSAVGHDVDHELIGKRVVAMCGLGGFAEAVIVSQDAIMPIPESLDSARAAAFIQSFCTARFALAHRAAMVAGDFVLVLGGAGGVGLASIAVARAAGARVGAVASTPQKRDVARMVGAEVAFDATSDPTELVRAIRDWSEGGVHIALDPVGGPLSLLALRATRNFGRLLVIGFPAGIPDLPANQILLRNRSVLGVDWGAWAMSHPDEQRALLGGLLDDVAAGDIDPPHPETRPLSDVVDALDDLLARRVTGKLVLVL